MTAQREQTGHALEIEDLAGYSQALRLGEFIYVAGQVGRNEAGKPIPEPGLVAKFHRAMANMEAVLGRLGSELSDVVYAQLHVTEDLGRSWADVTSLHRQYFGSASPATTIIQVNGLNHPDYLVEISAIAEARQTSEERSPQVTGREYVRKGTRLEKELGCSQAVIVGNHVFISGQLSVDKAGNVLHEKGVAGQFKKALENFAEVLGEAGGTLDDVVATHMFLTEFPDDKGFKDICDAHREAFSGKNRPTATMVYVPRLPLPGTMVEITGVAVLD